MKRIATLTGVILILGISIAVGQTTQPSTQPSAPINKFCAIEQEHKIDPKVTYVYNGKVIGFCCPECIPEFKKDPEKYMKGLK